MNHDIEAYLDGALDAEARQAFEKQLSGDPALQQAVAAARQVREDLDWLAVEQGVGQAQGHFWAKKRTKRRMRRIFLLLLASALAVALLLFQKKDNPSPGLPAVGPEHPVMPSTPVSPPDESPQKTEPNPATAPQAADRESRLFAAFFVPCKDPSLEPSQRGNAEMPPVERFLDHYWKLRYPEALALFETLETNDQTNDNLLFVKANCLLAEARAAEAAPLLENILRNDRSRFMTETRWYLALAYLKTGRKKQALKLLRELASDTASPFRPDATRLLQQW